MDRLGAPRAHGGGAYREALSEPLASTRPAASRRFGNGREGETEWEAACISYPTGNALSTDERELVDLYTRLKALSQRDDLPPVATANVKQAMVMLWNACNDLALVHEEPGCD